jgi:hypothetical protein
VTVPLHNERLQKCLEDRYNQLKAKDSNYLPDLTSDMKFLCEAWDALSASDKKRRNEWVQPDNAKRFHD